MNDFHGGFQIKSHFRFINLKSVSISTISIVLYNIGFFREVDKNKNEPYPLSIAMVQVGWGI